MRLATMFSTALISSAILFAHSAMATNGYFRVGFSANSIAMAGATTATAQDALAGASNPALANLIDNNYTVALSIFSPDRGFTVEGAEPSLAQPGEFALATGEVRSDGDIFLIPSFGYQRQLNDKFSVNIMVYGNGGMNTDYSESVFYAGATGVDLSQLFLNMAFAYEIAPATHLGFAPIVAYQAFEAQGVQSFAPFSQDAENLSDKGHDSAVGYGYRVGVLHQFSDAFAVGISYQSEIDFQEFDDYKGLFAENGSFDVPESYNLGFSYTHANYLVALDYQRINYSDIASIGNPLMPNLGSSLLGSDNGAGFGWQDMDIYKLGVAINGSSNNTYRAGISYGEQPIPDSEVLFNILAPGVQEWHITAGYEFESKGTDYAVTLMYSPSQKVKGRNPLYQSQTQTIELEMSQLELTLGASF